MVLRGTEANRTAGAVHSPPAAPPPEPHYHPVVFKESPYWCSFCSLSLYLSVSTALRKSDADRGQPEIPPPEGSMELCTLRSSPEVMDATPSLCQSRQTKLVLGKSGAGLESQLLRQSRKGNVPFNQFAKRSMNVSLTQAMTNPKCIRSSHGLNNR